MAGYSTQTQNNFCSGYHLGLRQVCGGQETLLSLQKGPQSLTSVSLSMADLGHNAESTRCKSLFVYPNPQQQQIVKKLSIQLWMVQYPSFLFTLSNITHEQKQMNIYKK
jgi:hypothetical protein